MRFKKSYDSKLKQYVKENHLTYCIDTMGCQMNENDSLKYRGILEDIGFTRATPETANVILFNTCCVRENAENTLFGRLGYLKSRKQKEKDVYLVVVGCMSQQKHILDKIKKSYSFTDIVLGTHSMDRFPEKLYQVICEKKKAFEYVEDRNEMIEEVPIIYEDKFKASVSIVYGCNNFCSYCIVPYVRGRERSRAPEDIIRDVQVLADKGYKEIMLLGQNVNSYGNTFDKPYHFYDLLKELEKIEGIEVIRFMSPHPKDFKDELIEVIQHSKKIARQVHLPLQAGSTRILKEMNRKYTKEQYIALAEKIKKADPAISLSTDIIVGFPGETEQDFQETLEVVRRVDYDQIYMFIYSPREGTRAAKMEDPTPHEEKVQRLERLKQVYEEKLPALNEKMVGKTYRMLIEGKSKNNDCLYTGRTSQNKVVVLEATEADVGKMREVTITSQHLWYLKGKLAEK